MASHLQLALPRNLLLPPHQPRVLRDNRPRYREESSSAALAAKLRLGTNMEEGKIPRYQMMRHPRRLVQDINLPVEHVLGLLVRVRGDVACRAGLDAVEARCEVGWLVLGLGLDGVEVCDDGGLALGDGDVLVACAFDDGEGDGVLRHCCDQDPWFEV